MPTISSDRMAQRLLELDLATSSDLQDAWAQLGRRDVPAETLLQCLMARGVLTNWQSQRLLNDYRIGFFYGNYKVLYLAGSGTFARVYRGVEKETERVVAIKVLRNRHVENADVVARFVREARVAMQFRHPNIVEVIDFSSERDTHYFIMEFVEGNNLRDFLKIRKHMDWQEATRVCIGIAEGLRYALQKGYTHRDLKVSNVLLSAKAEPKLIDFGLAAKKGEEIPRTVDYAGLEKATGAPKDDPRSDLFFLGTIYYHMLAGKPALGETRDRIARGARTRFIDVVPIAHAMPGLPPDVMRIVERAMDLNPNRRYQTPTEILLELRQALQRATGEPVTARQDIVAQPETQQTVMIVESNAENQEVLREGLKRTGYRVLLTADPQRALDRFAETPGVADCVIFCAGEIGGPALSAFNRFAADEKTGHLSAVIILGADQKGWLKRANVNNHRAVLSMPIKLGELRQTVAQVLAREAPEPEAEVADPTT
jgi:serine/threonine-protein kinase